MCLRALHPLCVYTPRVHTHGCLACSGRAIYEDSTTGIWPFNFDDDESYIDRQDDASCKANQCEAMRIPASSEGQPRYGLHKNQARGSPEIDVAEVMPGDAFIYYDMKYAAEHNCTAPDLRTTRALSYRTPMVSTSLQSAPGLPTDADQRPRRECAPVLYNNSAAPPWGMQMQWYEELDIFRYGKERSTEYSVKPNYAFWGELFTGMKWAGIEDPTVLPDLQTDALSANTQLGETYWTSFHTYRLEWRAGGDGAFMRWTLDGKLQFMIDSGPFKERRLSFNGKPGGVMKKRGMPREPMYVILNVDSSPKWGWGNKTALNCLMCDPTQCEKKRAEAHTFYDDLCHTLPDAKYLIDYVRVYQPPNKIQVGCDPPTHPTRRWIAGHADTYKQQAPTQNETIKKVARGGAACSDDASCNAPHGTCVTGACECSHPDNMTGLLYTGPSCKSQAGIRQTPPPPQGPSPANLLRGRSLSDSGGSGRTRINGPESIECYEFELMAHEASASCLPPNTYDNPRLNRLTALLCEASAAAGPTEGSTIYSLSTCTRSNGVIDFEEWADTCDPLVNSTDYTAWSACVDALSNCSARMRAATVLAEYSRADRAQGGSKCCNTFYTGSTGANNLTCVEEDQDTVPSSSSLDQWLDPGMRGVLYAPYMPGLNPILGDDLYADINTEYFVRDMRALHRLGATTVLLNSYGLDQLHGHRQALFNATNFIPSDGGKQDRVQSYVQQEESTWTPIQVIASLTLSQKDIVLGDTLEVSEGLLSSAVLSQKSTVTTQAVQTITQDNTQANAQETTIRYDGEAARSSQVRLDDASSDEALPKVINKEAKLRYFCDQAAIFASNVLTPDGNRRVTYDGLPFGAGAPHSKVNIRAINLDLGANDPDKWSDPYSLVSAQARIASRSSQRCFVRRPVLSMCAPPRAQDLLLDHDQDWNLFHISERMAQCASDVVMSSVPFRARPILVSLVDRISEPGTECAAGESCAMVDADDYIDEYRKYKELPSQMQTEGGVWTPPSVGGFVIKVSRSRGCDALGLAQSVAAQARRFQMSFGVSLELWFSIGVDAFDSREQMEYPAADGSGLDPQAACVLDLIKSVSDGCRGGGVSCGVILEEYSDSYWRASTAPTGNQVGCGTLSGSPERLEDSTVQHLQCGKMLACPMQQERCFQPSNNFSLRLCIFPETPDNEFCMLPGYLACDPYTGPEQAVGNGLPKCSPRGLSTDMEHNVAWDGLMRVPTQTNGSKKCTEGAHLVNSTLEPRRTFYAIMHLWNPPTLETQSTLPYQMREARSMVRKQGERIDNLWDNGWAVIGTLLGWALIMLVILACFRAVLVNFPQKQKGRM